MNPDHFPPQYGVFFVLLYVLDLFGIQMLFLPYLRLFFRIGAASGLNHRLPITLEPDRKIELADSTIYWDKANHAIWLCPSSLFRVHATVAKLTVDAIDHTIVGSEIRFSSGIMVSSILLLWVAYQWFTGPAATPAVPPAGLIAFGALGILTVGVNMRILRARMQKLIDGATAELSVM